MKKLSTVLATLAVIILAVSCADDVFIEPPLPLDGEYEGIYRYTENYQQTDQNVLEGVIVRWLFTQSTYNMQMEKVDPDDPEDSGKTAFCSPFGKYDLTDKVELREDKPGCQVISNEELNPEGAFVLQRPGDSLFMTQRNAEENAFIEIRLKRKPADEENGES